MDALSVEILEYILYNLDQPALLICSLVCSFWKNIIDNPQFYTKLTFDADHLNMLKIAHIRHPPSRNSEFWRYILWYRKYVMYRQNTWFSHVYLSKEYFKNAPSKLLFTLIRVKSNLSLGELMTEIERFIPIVKSLRTFINIIKQLIISFDAINLVLKTHDSLLREHEIWRNIYGQIKLFLTKPNPIDRGPSIEDTGVCADIILQFKANFCENSPYLKIFSSV